MALTLSITKSGLKPSLPSQKYGKWWGHNNHTSDEKGQFSGGFYKEFSLGRRMGSYWKIAHFIEPEKPALAYFNIFQSAGFLKYIIPVCKF